MNDITKSNLKMVSRLMGHIETDLWEEIFLWVCENDDDDDRVTNVVRVNSEKIFIITNDYTIRCFGHINTGYILNIVTVTVFTDAIEEMFNDWAEPVEPVEPTFPYASGDIVVLGPQVIYDEGLDVINYKGENYTVQEKPMPDMDATELVEPDIKEEDSQYLLDSLDKIEKRVKDIMWQNFISGCMINLNRAW
jgi:hypothetical protein